MEMRQADGRSTVGDWGQGLKMGMTLEVQDNMKFASCGSTSIIEIFIEAASIVDCRPTQHGAACLPSPVHSRSSPAAEWFAAWMQETGRRHGCVLPVRSRGRLRWCDMKLPACVLQEQQKPSQKLTVIRLFPSSHQQPHRGETWKIWRLRCCRTSPNPALRHSARRPLQLCTADRIGRPVCRHPPPPTCPTTCTVARQPRPTPTRTCLCASSLIRPLLCYDSIVSHSLNCSTQSSSSRHELIPAAASIAAAGQFLPSKISSAAPQAIPHTSLVAFRTCRPPERRPARRSPEVQRPLRPEGLLHPRRRHHARFAR